MEDINARIEAIETRQDLADVLQLITEQFESGVVKFDNDDIASFLSGMWGWTLSMDGYYKNQGIDFDEVPKWKHFAMIIMAGSIYE